MLVYYSTSLLQKDECALGGLSAPCAPLLAPIVLSTEIRAAGGLERA